MGEETSTESSSNSNPTVLSTDEVRSIVGDAIDEKLSALGLGEKLDKLDILDELLGRSNSAPDHSGLLDSIDKLIQKRVTAVNRSSGGSGNGHTETPSNDAGRKTGPLGRWLST